MSGFLRLRNLELGITHYVLRVLGCNDDRSHLPSRKKLKLLSSIVQKTPSTRVVLSGPKASYLLLDLCRHRKNVRLSALFTSGCSYFRVPSQERC